LRSCGESLIRFTSRFRYPISIYENNKGKLACSTPI
jgi:hypothetical protein